MTDRELMGQALLALELWRDALTDPAANHALRYASFGHDAAKALHDRLAQPEFDAVLAEREACAKVAEEIGYNGLGCRCALEAAATIRARGEK